MTHYSDVLHHPKEDLVFAKIKERDAAMASTVDDLHRQHARIHAAGAELVRQLDDVINGTIASRASIEAAARDYVDGLRKHMRVEESDVLPLAATLLDGRDWSAIHAADRARRRTRCSASIPSSATRRCTRRSRGTRTSRTGPPPATRSAARREARPLAANAAVRTRDRRRSPAGRLRPLLSRRRPRRTVADRAHVGRVRARERGRVRAWASPRARRSARGPSGTPCTGLPWAMPSVGRSRSRLRSRCTARIACP